MRFSKKYQAIDFFRCFMLSVKESVYTQVYRYSSFSPISHSNNVEFYVNAQKYFIGIYDHILNSKKEVLIAGWFISPELYLKRPYKKFRNSRLDRLLKLVAGRGVKVKILVYKENNYILYNDSQYVRDKLQLAHKNIQV